MLIDWFTVVAQIVNFLILIFLLKRFLYRPLLNALDRREKNIQDRLTQAEDAKNAANREAETLKKERALLNEKRDTMLEEAKTEAEKLKNQEIEKARAHARQKREEWLANLENEKQIFYRMVRQKLGRLVFKLSKKVIHDLSDVTLERHLVNSILQSEELFPESSSLQGVRQITVASGFALDDPTQEEIAQQLAAKDYSGPPITFTIDQDLGFGVEIIAGDRKFDWNLSRYLQDMEHETLEILSSSPKGEIHAR